MFKNFYKKTLLRKNKGFTLIELLVVISIISLLSSVVLASLKDSRDKAKVAKFRQEMQQFITALELYRAENGGYPRIFKDNTPNNFYSRHNIASDGNVYIGALNNKIGLLSEASTPGLVYDYSFLATAPKPKVVAGGTFIIYEYIVNNKDSYYGRCSGDSSIPEYFILIYGYDTLLNSAFSNWPEYQPYFSYNGTWSVPLAGSRCFSLK